MTDDPIATMHAAGLCIIPLQANSKKPTDTGWERTAHADFNPTDFEGCNVGILLGSPSGNVVDIDLDNPVALRIADKFLPKTGWEFGRHSTPRAHRLFRVVGEGGRTTKFMSCQEPLVIGGEKPTIVEYRLDGAQSMAPPSIHPDGEQVRFDRFGKVGNASREELLKGCGLIASVVELAPHYGRGARQDFILALSGTLIRAGLDEGDLLKLVEGLCYATSDEEQYQRIQAVVTTFKLACNDEPYVQRRALIDLIGPDGGRVVDKVVRHLGLNREPAEPAKPAASKAFDDEVNDTAVAKAYSEAARQRVLYSEEDGSYYVYEVSTGTWTRDPKRLRVMPDFIDHLETMIASSHASIRTKLTKYKNRAGATSALDQAQSYLLIPKGGLDANDMMLGVKNGLLDLKSGMLKPHSPEHRITRSLNVQFDLQARCPRFERFLNETFSNDRCLIAYVLGILGYCLTARMDRQEFYIFHGTGKNGKSVLVNLIARLLGDLAKPIMPETVFEGRFAQAYNDLATVAGCRLIYVPEAESNDRLNSSLIKRFTGQDNFKVKRVYRDVEEIRPTFKMIMYCNKLPNMDMCDGALKRRIKCVPFENTVPQELREPRLDHHLWEERSGILNLLLAGTRRYLDNAIEEPPQVRAATNSYFEGQNSISQFLHEYAVQETEASVLKGKLYDAYTDFCDEEHLIAVSKKDFGKYLLHAGYQEGKNVQGRLWKGLKLQEPLTLIQSDRAA